jgi:CheY-like chemotaxis protein
LSKVLSNTEQLTKTVVLLIDEVVFSKQKSVAESAELDWAKNIDLIGLCQPIMRELNSDTCQQLDNRNMPYILLDMPLYRYALEQITRVLIKKLPKLLLTDLPSSPTHAENRSDLSGINVLLVEDNLVNQLVAKELLMSLQAKVTIADNGQRALELLEEKVFDVVLMDIQMPIMDGLTATIAIRKQTKYQHLPIIAMTAHAREEDKQCSLAAGMNLHIAKPVTAKLLLISILKALQLDSV